LSSCKFSFIFRDVDYIQIMAYDFHGPWSHVTSFSAPLFSRISNPRFNTQLSQVSSYIAVIIQAQCLCCLQVLWYIFYDPPNLLIQILQMFRCRHKKENLLKDHSLSKYLSSTTTQMFNFKQNNNVEQGNDILTCLLGRGKHIVGRFSNVTWLLIYTTVLMTK
jgi:hypothetical protein